MEELTKRATELKDEIDEKQVRELIKQSSGPSLFVKALTLLFMAFGFLLLSVFLGSVLNFAIQLLRLGDHSAVIMGWNWQDVGACTAIVIVIRLLRGK